MRSFFLAFACAACGLSNAPPPATATAPEVSTLSCDQPGPPLTADRGEVTSNTWAGPWTEAGAQAKRLEGERAEAAALFRRVRPEHPWHALAVKCLAR